MSKLRDVTRYVRSKNAGPFWVTIDIFFDGPESYDRYRDAKEIGTEAIARMFGVLTTSVRRFTIDTLNVVKLSVPRAAPQGGVLERDMHSGQQYVPLLDVTIS